MWHMVKDVASHNFLDKEDFYEFSKKNPEKYGLIEDRYVYTGDTCLFVRTAFVNKLITDYKNSFTLINL